MRAKRAVLILGAMTALSLPPIAADDGENGISPAVSNPSNQSNCPGRPSNAKPTEYKILFVKRILSTDSPSPQVLPQPDSTPPINLQSQLQIRDETEYQSVFGKPSSGIDWSLSRIVVVPLESTYVLNQLESTAGLSGISQTSDGIYIGLTFTQVGPCQGIVQKDDWFSHDTLNYFILLPKKPEQVIYYSCVVGGCPPDIP
jgi:hypothetical protein